MSQVSFPSQLGVSLGDLRVSDAMHVGVISCTPETTLRSVARMLATYRVHAVVVFARHEGDLAHAGSWAVVTDAGLAQAARTGDVDQVTAGAAATGPVCCVTPDELLVRAIETMVADRLSHVVVVDKAAGRPLGILSLLDVARALAGYSWPGDER